MDKLWSKIVGTKKVEKKIEKKIDERWKTEFTTCECGNCSSAPGVNPNKSCDICNGTCKLSDFYKDKKTCEIARKELLENKAFEEWRRDQDRR